MKKLFLLILLLCLGFSKAGNAQTVLDSVKFSPGYICQVDSFAISMQTFLVSQGHLDSVQQFFRNDTLHLKGYLLAGGLAAPMRVKITIKVKTPPTGKYIMYFNRYVNDGFGSATNPYIYYGSHTDSFSVCMGAPLTVPENSSEKYLTAEVFPNPTQDILTIQLPETKRQTITATLTDVTGRKVLSQSLNSGRPTHQINIDKLPAGIYLLQLQSENSFRTIKVIKK